jgi:rhodanese-related sulfurtransferase/predicted transcriptional regulator
LLGRPSNSRQFHRPYDYCPEEKTIEILRPHAAGLKAANLCRRRILEEARRRKQCSIDFIILWIYRILSPFWAAQGADMSAFGPKQLAFEQFALTARALANRHRLELLDILAQGERSVDRLAIVSGLAIGTVSQHLQILYRAGLVTRRRAGTQIVYAISDPEVITVTQALFHLVERNGSELREIVRRFYANRDGLAPITRNELLTRHRRRSVVVIDVRPAEEFTAGHIPGAVSIPVGELKRRLKEVPKGRDIVAYCRGPYCVYAYEAVEILRSAGRAARRLQGGFLEWRTAGLPVIRDASIMSS